MNLVRFPRADFTASFSSSTTFGRPPNSWTPSKATWASRQLSTKNRNSLILTSLQRQKKSRTLGVTWPDFSRTTPHQPSWSFEIPNDRVPQPCRPSPACVNIHNLLAVYGGCWNWHVSHAESCCHSRNFLDSSSPDPALILFLSPPPLFTVGLQLFLLLVLILLSWQLLHWHALHRWDGNAPWSGSAQNALHLSQFAGRRKETTSTHFKQEFPGHQLTNRMCFRVVDRSGPFARHAPQNMHLQLHLESQKTDNQETSNQERAAFESQAHDVCTVARNKSLFTLIRKLA